MSKAVAIPSLTQYCLLLAIPIMALPHIDGLPWWVFVVSAGAFLWQWAVCAWQWSLPPMWLRTILAVASMVFIVEHYRSVQNLDAYVALLVTMHAQKTLEIRSRRDVFLSVFIGLFCIGTRLLYVQTLYSMLFTLLSLVFLFFTLHSFYANANTSLPRAIKNILALLLKASPLVLALFFLFPRVPPLIVIPDFTSSGVTGVSDRVSPGSLSSLAKSTEPAFRVEFLGASPTANELYWRGLVLERFDGQAWLRGNNIRATKRDWLQEIASNYPSYNYSVTMEATNQYWLFTLATAYSATKGTQAVTGFNLASKTPLLNTTVVDITSVQAPLLEGLSAKRWAYLTRLPNNNPQTVAWGQQLAQQFAGDPKAIVAAISSRFSDTFRYSLESPILGGDNIDEFLYSTQVGYCEHFASAAALTLRAAGIPARVVAGYMGGETNPYDNFLLVRQLDAHAWVEYWLPDSGWQHFDPTSVVAPERISEGSEASLRSRNEYQRGLGVLEITWFRNVSLWADSLNHQWTRWFLEYDRDSQFSLLEDVTGFKGSMERLLQSFIIVVLLAILPFFLFSLVYKLRTKLALALSLAIAEKGLRMAGLASATQYTQVLAKLPQSSSVEASYLSLQQLWDKVWYQGISPTLYDRYKAFVWASHILLWGLSRRFFTNTLRG